MSKGISETFDEHESDTARRGYPKEIVERATRTTKMRSVDLEQLVRSESGTRPVVSADDIERHVRERMEGAFQGTEGPQRMTVPIPPSGTDEDPHSRPTMELGVFGAVAAESSPAATLAEPEGSARGRGADTLALTSRETPVSYAHATPSKERRHVSVPRWLLTVMILGAMTLIAAAGAVGFAAGRLSRP